MFKELFEKTWSDKQQKYINLEKLTFWQRAKEAWHNFTTLKDYSKDPDHIEFICSNCGIEIQGRELYDKLGFLPNPKNKKIKCPNCGKNTLERYWN